MITELRRREEIDFSVIKATSSPYAIRLNEEAEIMKPHRYYGYIDQLNITPNERLVLGCVNYLMFATSMQVAWMLTAYPIDQNEIHKILTKLYNGGYLHRLQFRRGGEISVFKVYAVSGDRGYMLYKQVFGVKPNTKRDFFNQSDLAIRIKQILSANQLMAQLIDVKKSTIPSHSQVFSVERFLRRPMLIRTMGYFETGDICYWVEAVRRNEDYRSHFEDRLKRLVFFVKNHKRISTVRDAELPSQPRIIVIAEDAARMNELKQLVAAYDIPDPLFTHDMALVGKWEDAFQTL